MRVYGRGNDVRPHSCLLLSFYCPKLSISPRKRALQTLMRSNGDPYVQVWNRAACLGDTKVRVGNKKVGGREQLTLAGDSLDSSLMVCLRSAHNEDLGWALVHSSELVAGPNPVILHLNAFDDAIGDTCTLEISTVIGRRPAGLVSQWRMLPVRPRIPE